MRIKNWEKFQHYKYRNPPWVRLYKGLIDDPEFMSLSGDASKLLACCWLLASEHDGVLPSVEKIAWRLRMTVNAVKKLIPELSHWLIDDASTVLADCEQDAPSDTVQSTETEGRANARTILKSVLDEERAKAVVEHRQKIKKPLTAHAAKLLAEKFRKCADPNAAADTMVASGWQGFEPEWLTNRTSNGRGPAGEKPFVPTGPKRTWAEIRAERAAKEKTH
jgi:hypothetical protein